MKIQNKVGIGLRGVKFDILVKRKDNAEFEKITSGHNLILDSGLDLFASNLLATLTTYCRVGSGTTPVERDSATTTASRTGTTVTASTGFFEAGDVGRLIKFDSGEEDYIQTFNSSSSVETVGSGAIASSEFTIYYVDQTTLTTQLKSSTTYRTETGDNGTTESAGVLTYKRTHLFSAEAGAVTYNEIGWSIASTGNLFNRAIISGGVSLGAGDQLLVVSNLEVVQTPQTPTAQADIGTGGFNTSGMKIIEGYGLSAITSAGGSSSSGLDTSEVVLEPSSTSSNCSIVVSTDASPLNSYGTTINMPSTGTVYKAVSLSTYSNGNFYRDKQVTFSTTDFNSSNIRSLYLGRGSATARQTGLRILLDSTQGKNSSQTLFVRFRISFGRTLTNS